MQINLTGHHIDLTEALHNYVNTKFEKLERHFDHINDVSANNVIVARPVDGDAILVVYNVVSDDGII